MEEEILIKEGQVRKWDDYYITREVVGYRFEVIRYVHSGFWYCEYTDLVPIGYTKFFTNSEDLIISYSSITERPGTGWCWPIKWRDK